MAMSMAAKKRRLMPNLEELECKRRRAKSTLKEVEEAVMRLKESNLIDILGQSSNSSPSEEHCILWLVSSFGLHVVFRLISCWNVLPKALTELQTLRYISGYCNLPLEEVKTLLSFVQASCPSLFDTLKLPGDLPKVVAPPVLECLECGQQLVSNHSCKVRCYSERGVSLVDKVTLRCMNCKLFYNLTQYGNKRDTGFRFYPSPGDLVEATDSACAKRSLLELQCSLA